jgi:hypothetical protein
LTAGLAAIVLVAMPFLLPSPASPHRSRDPCPKDTAFPPGFHIWLLGFLTLASMVPEGAVSWTGRRSICRRNLGVGRLRLGLGFAFFAGAMAMMRFAGDSGAQPFRGGPHLAGFGPFWARRADGWGARAV